MKTRILRILGGTLIIGFFLFVSCFSPSPSGLIGQSKSVERGLIRIIDTYNQKQGKRLVDMINIDTGKIVFRLVDYFGFDGSGYTALDSIYSFGEIVEPESWMWFACQNTYVNQVLAYEFAPPLDKYSWAGHGWNGATGLAYDEGERRAKFYYNREVAYKNQVEKRYPVFKEGILR